ncbi:MAG: hypothetical protein Q4G50_03505 [Corynebacterium sp.]|uniref:hypothetical protein n=1 Tax=Corynebacterium sp. TaxID=1720 RepID=UPI0026DF794C|nr:hypothetical protein [Corynebacterium sp.]MDO5669049.1 hypothetical protein [Corynebacterium sp.]
MNIRPAIIVTIASQVLAVWLAWAVGGGVGLLIGVLVSLLGISAAVLLLTRSPEDATVPSEFEVAEEHHRQVLDEYSRWELDPEMLLRFPGLWDRSRPEVHRYFDALAAAGQATAADYPDAVEELRMAWAGAQRYARSTGTSALAESRRTEAETGLKLYRHAQGAATEQERATYYRRALETVRSLIDAGLLPSSLPAVEKLESLQRGELT